MAEDVCLRGIVGDSLNILGGAPEAREGEIKTSSSSDNRDDPIDGNDENVARFDDVSIGRRIENRQSGDNSDWPRYVPREVWEKCFDYLSPQDLTQVAQTCSQFATIANDARYWRHVDFGREWGRFLIFHPEFLAARLGDHANSITLTRSPGFEFTNEDDFLGSLYQLPLSDRLLSHPARLTSVDLSGAYHPNIRCDVISAQNASDRLAQILLPLNDCLERLRFPKGPQFSRFLTSTLSLLPASAPLLPRLSSLWGSFTSDDVKLLPTLSRLESLRLDGHVYKNSNAVTLHVFTKLEPTFLAPLLDCAALTDLGLPLIDANFVSLFSPCTSEPSSLAFNLECLTLGRVHLSESYLVRLLSACSRLRSLDLRELRLFNPRHTNPFATISTHLRRFRLRFPRDGEFVPPDLESHLLTSLSSLPSLETVELDDFSCRPELVTLFPNLHEKIRNIAFRCQSTRDVVSLIAVVDKLRRLDSLYLNFPESRVDEENRYDDGVGFPCFVKFRFAGKYLRIRGEAPPYVLKFMIQPPYALNTLDVGVEALGLALLKWPSTLTPLLSKLTGLLLQVESSWHEDVMREILTSTTSLRSLHVAVASGGELAAQREAEALLRDGGHGALGPGIASGSKTFHCVVEFLETSWSMEELNFTFATPLPYQFSDKKLTVSGIKETLFRLKERLADTKIKRVNVNVAVINSFPWKMQLVRNCLGKLNHHF